MKKKKDPFKYSKKDIDYIVNGKISKMTARIRQHERETKAAQEYAQALKHEIKVNTEAMYYDNKFIKAGRMIDMYQERDWATIDPNKKISLTSFMHTAQKAEKFRMDMANWSSEAIKENIRCMKKHMEEGLGLLPFEKILFQTRNPSISPNINFHLFEYVSKDIDKNYVVYNHRVLIFKKDKFVVKPMYLNGKTLKAPLDFSKKLIMPTDTTMSIFHAFIQLNSHTDKNTNIFDILPKKEKPKPKERNKMSNDTTYTSDVSDESSHEKRFIPYHSVRGHIRRLRKGDITAVRSHFRGQKEYGAIHKNYVLAPPRILRKGKVIWKQLF